MEVHTHSIHNFLEWIQKWDCFFCVQHLCKCFRPELMILIYNCGWRFYNCLCRICQEVCWLFSTFSLLVSAYCSELICEGIRYSPSCTSITLRACFVCNCLLYTSLKFLRKTSMSRSWLFVLYANKRTLEQIMVYCMSVLFRELPDKPCLRAHFPAYHCVSISCSKCTARWTSRRNTPSFRGTMR